MGMIERFGKRGLVAAGLEASRLSMDEVARSSDEGRVPISGALVTALPDGRLKVQTRINGTRGYHNCRIPGPMHSPSYIAEPVLPKRSVYTSSMPASRTEE